MKVTDKNNIKNHSIELSETELKLEQYRKEYNTLKQEKEALIKAQEELKELLEDENVQRYIELADLVDLEYKPEDDYKLAEKAYSISKNNDTNKIMVYMGSYIWNRDAEITYEDNPNATYKAYMDLESLDAYNITLDKVEEFEKNHITIYNPVDMPISHEYSRNFFKIRRWYLMELISKTPYEVINLLKKLVKFEQTKVLTSSDYSQIHLNAENPITVENFDPETFVLIYPANGYVEKYCLSNDQQKLVKLCRTLKNEDK